MRRGLVFFFDAVVHMHTLPTLGRLEMVIKNDDLLTR